MTAKSIEMNVVLLFKIVVINTTAIATPDKIAKLVLPLTKYFSLCNLLILLSSEPAQLAVY